jgi:UDP-N-acetylmuramyl pentapeptide synthase
MLNLLKLLKKRLTTSPDSIGASDHRPIVFLFGDMRELGDGAKTEHEVIAQKLIGIVDYLYCVGPLTREYVITYIGNLKLLAPSEAEGEIGNLKFKNIRCFDTSIRAGEYLKDHLPKNALVLVKGSQNTIFLEEAIKYILADKKDEAWLCRQEQYWLRKKERFFQRDSAPAPLNRSVSRSASWRTKSER